MVGDATGSQEQPGSRDGDGLWRRMKAMALRVWASRLSPNANLRGQYAPRLRRLWIDVVLAVAAALAFEWVLFGLLGTHDDVSNWTWPWIQVQALNGEESSLVQPAIALLTPVVALVTAVFAYRNATIRLAESQRADVAAFQQRFIDGARLLADPNAHTRVAGAIALGSLARDWVENRQEVVDVMCGYLRTKPSEETLTEPAGPGSKYEWHKGEDNVRTTLVEQLVRTLKDSADARDPAEHFSVNLQGAWLAGAPMSGTAFTQGANFGYATFTHEAQFGGATFTHEAQFEGATFTQDANFEGTTFTEEAQFSAAAFDLRASFVSVAFMKQAIFHKATFSNDASFLFVPFNSYVDFGEAEFGDHANFGGARFVDGAWFGSACFSGGVNFGSVTFTQRASFLGATLAERFSDSVVDGATRGPLGPLGQDSHLPDPPGNLVDDDGTVVGEVRWYRKGEDPDDKPSETTEEDPTPED